MTRATDLPKEARAFLDALAVGESGGKDDDAAYSVLFGGSHFFIMADSSTVMITSQRQTFPGTKAWPGDFPNWPGVWIGGVPTHAAGRYQFEPATWRGLGGGSFDPVSQDHRAWALACEVMPSLLTHLQANNGLAQVALNLQSTWTSLSSTTFPKRYATALSGT
jgi:hypothetical protein